MFIITLAATVTREALLTNYSITADLSALRVLLLAGLYVSSMSSCLGAMYGTPRVLQSISNEKVIPGLEILGHGVSFLSKYCDFILINRFSHVFKYFTFITYKR